jgi:hypothetical protein
MEKDISASLSRKVSDKYYNMAADGRTTSFHVEERMFTWRVEGI